MFERLQYRFDAAKMRKQRIEFQMNLRKARIYYTIGLQKFSSSLQGLLICCTVTVAKKISLLLLVMFEILKPCSQLLISQRLMFFFPVEIDIVGLKI